MPNLRKNKSNKIKFSNTNAETKESNFKNNLINENMIASNNIRSANFNLEQARQLSDDALVVLGAEDGLQSMLVAQMLSIHKLQQAITAFAQSVIDLEAKKPIRIAL